MSRQDHDDPYNDELRAMRRRGRRGRGRERVARQQAWGKPAPRKHRRLWCEA